MIAMIFPNWAILGFACEIDGERHRLSTEFALLLFLSNFELLQS